MRRCGRSTTKREVSSNSMTVRRKPELLCPAGSMEALRTALHFGADAVYGGMKAYGLRAFAGNFGEEQLREAVELVHSRGKKFYLTMNIMPFDDQLEGFVQAAKTAHAIGVDAAIVTDIGAIVTLREQVPGLALHVSTQASTVNTPAVKHYQQLGCERVILAREVGLERISAMTSQLEGMEIETFVHGASCVAYSGRCLLSSALTGRSGNQGACAQPCRWQYAVMEMKRPGEYLPVCEDANGTYIFSAKDLNLMPILPELVNAGVASLKIEGRMKTEYYVAVVTGAYRRAIDLLWESEDRFRQELPTLMAELACASHRESDTGFMLGAPEVPGGAEGFHQEREYIGRVMEDAAADEGARILLKNRFYAGDRLEVMTSGGVLSAEAKPFLREKTGEILDTLGVAGEIIRMQLPFPVQAGDMLRGPVRNHRR